MKNTTKRCPKCGETKEIRHFSKDKYKKDNLDAICRACRSISYKKYRLANEVAIKKRQKAWFQARKGKKNHEEV